MNDKRSGRQTDSTADSGRVDQEMKTSSFLVRMPPALRSQLEELKAKSKARSLQSLIVQILAQGVSQEEGLAPVDLLAPKDVPVRVVCEAIRAGSTRREAHQRVVRDLEAQRMSGAAALMEVALDSFRRLSEYATFTEDERQKIDVASEFAAGLQTCAHQAMGRQQWGLAEELLLHAVEVNPGSASLREDTGVFLLRRFVRRWMRSTITAGVTNGFLFGAPGLVPGAKDETDSDRTDRALVSQIVTLLEPATADGTIDPGVRTWALLADLIQCAIDSEFDHTDESRDRESAALSDAPGRFWTWSRSFTRIGRVGDLERAWERYVEALEILWWLGYRKEAQAIALDTRGFEGSEGLRNRLRLVARWDSDKIEIVVDDGELIYTVWELYGDDQIDDDGRPLDPRDMPECPLGLPMAL